jgi:DNA-binding transcriptional MerR regulator
MKAPDAFRTISEVAEELDLPQHVLRFWETRFSQIKPMKRGGGRRYYRPEDVDLLRGVRLLLYSEGFTIRGVQRLLKEKGVAYVAEVGQTGSAAGASAEAAEADAQPDRELPAWEEDAAEPEPAPEPAMPVEREHRPKLDPRTDPGFAPPEAEPPSEEEEGSLTGEAPDPASRPEHARPSATRAAAEPARAVDSGPTPASVSITAPAVGLSHSDRRKIEAALADILEAKRLLDQVR